MSEFFLSLFFFFFFFFFLNAKREMPGGIFGSV